MTGQHGFPFGSSPSVTHARVISVPPPPLEAHITWHNEVNHDILSPSQMQWPAELWATVWLDRGGRRGLRTFSILIPDACSRQSQEDIF